MSRDYTLLIVMFSLIWIYSCEKDPITIDVEGNVYDTFLEQNVSGALVQFYVQEVENGIVSFQDKFIGSVSTDFQGNYKYNIDYRNASVYRMRIVKDKYIAQEREIAPDNWPPDEVNIENFLIVPEAYFQVHVKNVNPVFDEDQLLFQLNYDSVLCSYCCNDIMMNLTGNADTTINCTLAGETFVNIFYIANTPMGGTYDLDFFCPAFDTTSVDIFY